MRMTKMTDKELKDWCKTCNVEPPAMKFKCPECEHNPDNEQIIIDDCNVSNCKYYMENNGVEYQGLYQYTNMCYKQPYDNCENKLFCWHKLVTRIKRIFKYGR